EVTAAAEAALASAGAERGELAAAVFSLAGADWPEDFDFLRESLSRRLDPRTSLTVVNDAIGAIRCGMPDGVGVAIPCGAGSAVGARGTDGSVFHIGFWPDAGGARWLAQEALKAVHRAGLGTGP